MSTCTCTVGRHNLDTSSLERTARQLSDIFDLNIRWGYFYYDHDEEQGRIVKHPDRSVYLLDDNSDGVDPVLFQLECFERNEEDRRLPFFGMDIYREMIEISFYGWPYKNPQLPNCFENPVTALDSEVAGLLREFRLKCRAVFGKLRAQKVFHFSEGWRAGFLEETPMNMPANEYEDFILSGRYIDEAEERAGHELQSHSAVISISDFLTGKNPQCAPGGADVYMDDFADLE